MRPANETLRLACAAALLLIAPRAARADPVTSLALEPAPAGDPSMAVERATVRGDGLLTVRFLADLARRPLALANRRGDTDVVVNSQIWLHTLVTYAIGQRVALHLDLPAVLGQTEGDHPATGRAAPPPDAASAFGDLRIGARFSLLSPERREARGFDVALGASAWLPTGNDAYTSDGTLRGGAALMVDGEVNRFYWAGSAGVRGRPTTRLGFSDPVRSGTAVAIGAAAGIYLDSRHALSLGPELAATTTITGASPLERGGAVAHLLLGAHYLSQDGPLDVGVAAGPGFGAGPGAADYRVMLHVGMVPERALLRPVDSDGDAIFDGEDACRAVRGVRSDDPEKNGCPAMADMDSDHIADEVDACPTSAGEPSPERMLNGCPPLPATASGAELTAQAIVIDQQIAFETGSAILLRESDAILTDVARVMEAHPEIELLEVQGHTDERGTVDYNRKLSQDRAASVVTWLTQHGATGSRLVARGYGRERPIADNTTEDGMQKNRRVEFHVLRARAPHAP